MGDPDRQPDYVWRFRLDEKPLARLNEDPVLDLIRVQWEELLKLCVPCCGDDKVKVDGFRLMRSPETVHPIFADDPRWKAER